MLTLYYHPLSSNCWKVLIALYEAGADFTPRMIDHTAEADRALIAGLTPMGKMPALGTPEGTLWETAIINEWLAGRHPGAGLLPEAEALEVRLWERFFDLYIHEPMQRIVTTHLFLSADTAAETAAAARRDLDRAYAALEARMIGRDWAAAGRFTLADCAAAPALFYAATLHPLAPHPAVAAYLERLVARPAVARVLEEARPVFHFYPFAAAIPARFR